MFERYDEAARRTLFFARYEASRLGTPTIETEHLLLGLMREPKGHAGKLLVTLPQAEIRKELEANRNAEKISTSVEIPFSVETKRVLYYARDEADALTHLHIGPEHLLLGLMQEPESRAAIVLARYGMQLERARELVRESHIEAAAKPVSRSAVQAQLEQIIELVHQLGRSLSDNPDAALQVHLLLLELETLKALLDEARGREQ
jgi:ATP-dependent Clp protease ATP-binding subunit ClpC